MKTKRVLNVSLAVFLILTASLVIYELVQLEKEAEHLAGHELLGTATAEAFLGSLFVSAVVIEISLYFNLRYFLLCQNKTVLKTIMNIIMVVVTGCFVIPVFLFPVSESMKLPESLWVLFLGSLILLRIVNYFIPTGKSDPTVT